MRIPLNKNSKFKSDPAEQEIEKLKKAFRYCHGLKKPNETINQFCMEMTKKNRQFLEHLYKTGSTNEQSEMIDTMEKAFKSGTNIHRIPTRIGTHNRNHKPDYKDIANVFFYTGVLSVFFLLVFIAICVTLIRFITRGRGSIFRQSISEQSSEKKEFAVWYDNKITDPGVFIMEPSKSEVLKEASQCESSQILQETPVEAWKFPSALKQMIFNIAYYLPLRNGKVSDNMEEPIYKPEKNEKRLGEMSAFNYNLLTEQNTRSEEIRI